MRYDAYLSLLKDIVCRKDQPLHVNSSNWEHLLMIPVDQMISTLLPQQQSALRLRYGLDSGERMTYKQVGEKLHRSGSRIGQIIQKALRMLRYTTRGHYFWLLYGIDRRYDGNVSNQRWGDYRDATGITEDQLREAAAGLTEYYRKYTSAKFEKAGLEAYTAFHIGHDPYFERNWRKRQSKNRGGN